MSLVRMTGQAFGKLAATVGKGLLTDDASCGKPLAPTRVDVSLEDLIDSDTSLRIKIRPLHVWAAFSAWTSALRQLKEWQIKEVVRTFEQRKANMVGTTVDITRLRELTAIYRKLRPL